MCVVPEQADQGTPPTGIPIGLVDNTVGWHADDGQRARAGASRYYDRQDGKSPPASPPGRDATGKWRATGSNFLMYLL